MREHIRIRSFLLIGRTLLIAFFLAAPGFAVLGQQASYARRSVSDRGLRMTQAIVCKSIEGYERYEKLPGAAMTSEEKLLLYFLPLNYKTSIVDGVAQAHFTEDGQIRRREDKVVVREKLRMLEYKTKIPDLSKTLFLRNSISLKGLPPGEYEFVVTLHDEVSKAPPARQVVRFRVIPAHDPRKPEAPAKTKGDTPEPAASPE